MTVLRIRLFSIFFLSAFLLFGQDSSSDKESEWILNEINVLRERYGVQALRTDTPSNHAAYQHAGELGVRQTLSHWSLDGSRVAERYRAAGGTGLRAAENLGAGESVKSIIDAWMDSPTHRRNILNSQWFSAGVGVYHNNDKRIIIVLVFNNSRWMSTGFKIENNIAYLDGKLWLSTGIFPETVIMRSCEMETTPFSASKDTENSIRLHFEFPKPENWISGEIAVFELELLENSEYQKTDLIFYNIP